MYFIQSSSKLFIESYQMFTLIAVNPYPICHVTHSIFNLLKIRHDLKVIVTTLDVNLKYANGIQFFKVLLYGT